MHQYDPGTVSILVIFVILVRNANVHDGLMTNGRFFTKITTSPAFAGS